MFKVNQGNEDNTVRYNEASSGMIVARGALSDSEANAAGLPPIPPIAPPSKGLARVICLDTYRNTRQIKQIG